MSETKKMVIGYKGFEYKDGKLICRDFEFELDKINLTTEKLIECSSGFHYCNTLPKTFDYYGLKEEHIWAKIEVLGDVIAETNSDKCVTNAFRILELYKFEEIEQFQKLRLIINSLAIVDEVLAKYPNLIICGRLGLMIQGLVPIDRKQLKDIDFVSDSYINLKEKKKVGIFNDSASNLDEESIRLADTGYDSDNFTDETHSIIDFELQSGEKANIDIFYDPIQPYEVYEINGKEYKVAKPWNAIKAKFKYAMHSPKHSSKHLEDLKNIFKNLKYNDGGYKLIEFTFNKEKFESLTKAYLEPEVELKTDSTDLPW